MAQVLGAAAAKQQTAEEQIKGKAVRSTVSVAPDHGMRDISASSQDETQMQALLALLNPLYD